MQQFVFPAIVYEADECYVLHVKDLGIICEGDTVEQCFIEAKQLLGAYCKVALTINGCVDEATSFKDTIEKEKQKNLVILVDSIL